MRHSLVLVMAVTVTAHTAAAQEPRAYAGATIAALAQSHSETEVGGTTWDASVLVGVWLKPHIAVEFEPTFGRTFSSTYSCRPAPDFLANVITSRRDTYFPVQVRFRIGPIEPLVGGGYLRTTEEAHATVDRGQAYFDDERSANGFVVTFGADVPVTVSSRVAVFPSVRVLVPARDRSGDAIAQTDTGAFALRFGVGARVAF